MRSRSCLTCHLGTCICALSKRVAEIMQSIGFVASGLRAANSSAGRNDRAFPSIPDFPRTTHVAGSSRSAMRSDVPRLFPCWAFYPLSRVRFFAVIRRRALEWRSSLAANRVRSQKGKPVIVEIEERPPSCGGSLEGAVLLYVSYQSSAARTCDRRGIVAWMVVLTCAHRQRSTAVFSRSRDIGRQTSNDPDLEGKHLDTARRAAPIENGGAALSDQPPSRPRQRDCE